jgi:glycosyltransferase involved in cell wall biosynthesis
MTESLVSIIIPVYNGEKYLGEATESILAQTYRPIEIIVVDDGSTDGSSKVAQRFSDHVHYLYQSNRGCHAARNTGIKAARGSYYAFLDADDLWTEDKLARQIAVMEADPGLQIVFGHVSHFYSPDIDAITKQKIQCPIEKMPGYHHGTILVTRTAFLDIGLFSEKWACGEFLDWSFRAQEKGYRSVMMPEVVMKRRIHSSNRGILVRDIRPDYVRVLKASLDRRRKKFE